MIDVDPNRLEQLYAVCERAVFYAMQRPSPGSFGQLVERAAREKEVVLTEDERGGLVLATARAAMKLRGV